MVLSVKKSTYTQFRSAPSGPLISQQNLDQTHRASLVSLYISPPKRSRLPLPFLSSSSEALSKESSSKDFHIPHLLSENRPSNATMAHMAGHRQEEIVVCNANSSSSHTPAFIAQGMCSFNHIIEYCYPSPITILYVSSGTLNVEGWKITVI